MTKHYPYGEQTVLLCYVIDHSSLKFLIVNLFYALFIQFFLFPAHLLSIMTLYFRKQMFLYTVRICQKKSALRNSLLMTNKFNWMLIYI